MQMLLGPPERALTPFIVWPAAALLAVAPARLRPLDAVARLEAPVLIVGGLRDRYTPIADTRALHAAAPQPKELADAGHDDFERHAPAAWRQRVLAFLERHLGR